MFIDINEYDYPLNEQRIAKYPLNPRDKSKLLIYENGQISVSTFENIHNFIEKGSLLVLNNTKVVHARIHFFKKSGSKIEIFCLKPFEPADYQQNFSSVKTCKWECIVGNAKKWKNEELVLNFQLKEQNYQLKAKKIENLGETRIIEFQWDAQITFAQLLEIVGKVPIPPYLNRESENIDHIAYQTVYSKIEGSVAAPTAGLHFTENVFKNLKHNNVEIKYITLHVGAGTFKPVSVSNALEHQMHEEFFFVKKDFIDYLLKNPSKSVYSVGTTTLRTLESLYWIGVKIYHKDENPFFVEQYVYKKFSPIDKKTAFFEILNFLEKKSIDILQAFTQIYIVPGYEFKVVNNLVTNFHQPKSTLLLLVAAFVGDDWKKIYDYALKNNFRFLSYGDSSLLKSKH